MILHKTNKKLVNDLPGEMKRISTKRLIEDFMYKYSILNGAKYFSEEEGSQDYLVLSDVSDNNLNLRLDYFSNL